MSNINVTDKTTLPLDATDVARLYRKAYGRPTMTEEDFEFADALMRECVLRIGVELLRDKFAGQAMQGLASREGSPDVEYESKLAYRYADAMLKARGAAQ